MVKILIYSNVSKSLRVQLHRVVFVQSSKYVQVPSISWDHTKLAFPHLHSQVFHPIHPTLRTIENLKPDLKLEPWNHKVDYFRNNSSSSYFGLLVNPFARQLLQKFCFSCFCGVSSAHYDSVMFLITVCSYTFLPSSRRRSVNRRALVLIQLLRSRHTCLLRHGAWPHVQSTHLRLLCLVVPPSTCRTACHSWIVRLSICSVFRLLESNLLVIIATPLPLLRLRF